MILHGATTHFVKFWLFLANIYNYLLHTSHKNRKISQLHTQKDT